MCLLWCVVVVGFELCRLAYLMVASLRVKETFEELAVLLLLLILLIFLK